VYDPVETLEWMIGEALAALREDELPPARPGGRPRRKSKAQRQADEVRLATLTETLWNLLGRPEPLDVLAERVHERIAMRSALAVAA
jgi:hypothetical protein